MSFQKILEKIFGTANERELKALVPIVKRVNELEASIKPLTDTELKAKTAEFRARLAKGESLDDLLPEAFAVVREASIRTLGMRHFDVQIMGGVTLHRGKISEMKTGEGKTLVATLPVYLNALSGKGVHVVTVNDYLAKRDSAQMGQIYGFLGLTTGVIVHGLTDAQRQANYGCDVTYGTNNEFGFDYLRDNMKFRLEDYVQRELNYAIVDEVDSILIDEARTPLIISGPAEASTDLYYRINEKVLADGGLEKETDYSLDEKSKTASLTEAGVEKMERRLNIKNLFDPSNIEVLHHVNQALRANVLFKRDVDYVVRDGEVMIVDEFTGRLMPGRRWSDGLHQAIEAKEGVTIENENQTLATITFQNYFRMYNKLAGMTGTADTEATEFKQIYKLDVSVVPTNRPMVRLDQADVIYKSASSKYKAILEEIKRLNAKGQPVLVGTISVEKSELIANMLKREGIKHHVLNAKQHEREADVVAQAGRKGSVTIATNMAGRGTDILLGGNPVVLARAEAGTPPAGDKPQEEQDAYKKRYEEALKKWQEKCATEKAEVLAAGGLFILGTERHESRRIDNQLRGRSGRQGDPGESRFYLSLEDDLMRIFGGVNIARFMDEDMPIEHRWITKAIANAQKKVEGHNYDIRKHLLQYDDVMNQQRKVVYSWRREVLSQPSLRGMVFTMVDELAAAIAEDFFPRGKLRKVDGRAWLNEKELNDAVKMTIGYTPQITEKDINPFNDKGLKDLIIKRADEFYRNKEQGMGDETVRQLERMILLTTIDTLWKDHLLAMDHLREGVGLQGYGQKDPLVEYKKGGFRYFSMMMNQITGEATRKLFTVQLMSPEMVEQMEEELEEADEELDGSNETPATQNAKAKFQYNVSPEGELVQKKAAADVQRLLANKMRAQAPMTLGRGAMPMGPGGQPMPQGMGAQAQPQPVMAQSNPGGFAKVGRNDVCPCGSGKKYKKCHGS